MDTLDKLGRTDGSGKLRYQVFLENGTFTPPPELVAAGGQCWAEIISGGGGGSISNGNAGMGGGEGWKLIVPMTILVPTSVVVGLGGPSNSTMGARGGQSSVGAVVVKGGYSGYLDTAGNGASNGSYLSGGGYGGGASVQGNLGIPPTPGEPGLPNTGGGGGGGSAGNTSTTGGPGGSGKVTVWWSV